MDAAWRDGVGGDVLETQTRVVSKHQNEKRKKNKTKRWCVAVRTEGI